MSKNSFRITQSPPGEPKRFAFDYHENVRTWPASTERCALIA